MVGPALLRTQEICTPRSNNWEFDHQPRLYKVPHSKMGSNIILLRHLGRIQVWKRERERKYGGQVTSQKNTAMFIWSGCIQEQKKHGHV